MAPQRRTAGCFAISQTRPDAARVMGLDAHAYNTRRWFYYIPRVGQPQKIVHSIEAKVLDAVPAFATSIAATKTALRFALGP